MTSETATIQTTAAAKARKARPSIRDRAAEKICPNCGSKVERQSARGPFPTFCSNECKRDHNNRHMAEGRAMAAFIKAWRIDRGAGEIAQQSFSQLCEIADQFNAADLAAGRPRADYYAATMLADGTRYLDRQRTR